MFPVNFYIQWYTNWILFILIYCVIAGFFTEKPPIQIRLVEGQNVDLEYKLFINSFQSSFMKNDQLLTEKKHIEQVVDGLWRILKITNVTAEDGGEYCLEVGGHRSRQTKLIIQSMYHIFIDYTCRTRVYLSVHFFTKNLDEHLLGIHNPIMLHRKCLFTRNSI